MTIELRPATEEDAISIADLYINSRTLFLPYAPSAHSESEIREYIKGLVSNGVVTVATESDTIQGFLAIARAEGYGEIDQLYLDLEAVGKGTGTLLLNHAKLLLGAPIRLYTFQQNLGARRFYERNGFVPIEFGDGTKNEEQCPDVLYEWKTD